jgi:hypothetical protein
MQLSMVSSVTSSASRHPASKLRFQRSVRRLRARAKALHQQQSRQSQALRLENKSAIFLSHPMTWWLVVSLKRVTKKGFCVMVHLRAIDRNRVVGAWMVLQREPLRVERARRVYLKEVRRWGEIGLIPAWSSHTQDLDNSTVTFCCSTPASPSMHEVLAIVKGPLGKCFTQNNRRELEHTLTEHRIT